MYAFIANFLPIRSYSSALSIYLFNNLHYFILMIIHSNPPLFLIKPTQDLSKTPKTLNNQLCLDNRIRGLETTIFLDLMILSKIREIMIGQEEFSNTFLNDFVNFFDTLGDIYLAPGLALDEVSLSYAEITHSMFEDFCKIYFPGLKNAYNSLPFSLHTKHILRFFDLNSNQQSVLASSYACMLYIHYVLCFKQGISNVKKFEYYIDTLLEELDLLDFVSCLVAVFCFREGKHTPKTIKELKDNFLKKHSKGHMVIKNSLNAARDIINYRSIAYLEIRSQRGLTQGSKPLDAWLLTADKGVKILSELIAYNGLREGELQANPSSEILYDDVVMHNYSYLISNAMIRSASRPTLNSEAKEIIARQKVIKLKKFICRLEESFLSQ